MTSRPLHPRPDLARLTGVRSGKRSYYRAYVASDERMQRAVTAMDSISRALVRTVEGPRGLLEEVVRAAAAHLDARWTLLALHDGQLSGARPRFVVADNEGRAVVEESVLPTEVRRVLAELRAGRLAEVGEPGWVRVPMTLEGRRIGDLVAQHGLAEEPEQGDLSVLRILANQAAVSLHTSEQYQAGLSLHRRAQQLYDEATAQSRDLADRTRELRAVEERLQVAHQRELLDTERHRIARELHDSVTQYVLSAGMSVEIARLDAEDLGSGARSVVAELETAKRLSQEAVEQLRRAIWALHQPHGQTVATLPELAREVAVHHRGRLDVSVRTHGEARALQADADHELARAIGEALFNVVAHSGAARAAVQLRYRDDELLVSVSDDGHGDPVALRRLLELERRGTADGRHRGLANIESRIVDLGGTVAFRRARLGGVRVELRLPLPLAETPLGALAGAPPDLADHLADHLADQVTGPSHPSDPTQEAS
ncbi:Signal transduction histidine kinase [Nocardioides scoriae]|uniref:Signal transduction histidine kinase n=1 Tax=Nocardioides scoriae TaxID=642780 RepID=A0A1H1VX72_9ACTN|nr:histidine kinase [Nocardioides scoriae]SDS89467.1 Signal transduction histidine kinase [Nocardioides scoriae]